MKQRHLIALIIIIAILLWGYGFVKASHEVKSGLSDKELTASAESLNPVTKSGYITYLHNNTELY
ncbi:MAG: hypothetical protein K6G51_03150 [Sphaerochaetaceae bacterium]|nr:hypothetical protein [Sphaerochaetaceae bacterium]